MLPGTKFDGRVYTSEMLHPKAIKSYHIDFSEHMSQLFDYRIIDIVINEIYVAV